MLAPISSVNGRNFAPPMALERKHRANIFGQFPHTPFASMLWQDIVPLSMSWVVRNFFHSTHPPGGEPTLKTGGAGGHVARRSFLRLIASFLGVVNIALQSGAKFLPSTVNGYYAFGGFANINARTAPLQNQCRLLLCAQWPCKHKRAHSPSRKT